jgi:hypothetical protein
MISKVNVFSHLNSSASLNLIRASVARFGYDFFVTL